MTNYVNSRVWPVYKYITVQHDFASSYSERATCWRRVSVCRFLQGYHTVSSGQGFMPRRWPFCFLLHQRPEISRQLGKLVLAQISNSRNSNKNLQRDHIPCHVTLKNSSSYEYTVIWSTSLEQFIGGSSLACLEYFSLLILYSQKAVMLSTLIYSYKVNCPWWVHLDYHR